MNGKTERRAHWERLKTVLDAAEIPFVLAGSYCVRVDRPEPGSVYMLARVSEGGNVRARWFATHGPVLDPDRELSAQSMNLLELEQALRAWRLTGDVPGLDKE